MSEELPLPPSLAVTVESLRREARGWREEAWSHPPLSIGRSVSLLRANFLEQKADSLIAEQNSADAMELTEGHPS